MDFSEAVTQENQNLSNLRAVMAKKIVVGTELPDDSYLLLAAQSTGGIYFAYKMRQELYFVSYENYVKLSVIDLKEPTIKLESVLIEIAAFESGVFALLNGGKVLKITESGFKSEVVYEDVVRIFCFGNILKIDNVLQSGVFLKNNELFYLNNGTRIGKIEGIYEAQNYSFSLNSKKQLIFSYQIEQKMFSYNIFQQKCEHQSMQIEPGFILVALVRDYYLIKKNSTLQFVDFDNKVLDYKTFAADDPLEISEPLLFPRFINYQNQAINSQQTPKIRHVLFNDTASRCTDIFDVNQPEVAEKYPDFSKKSSEPRFVTNTAHRNDLSAMFDEVAPPTSDNLKSEQVISPDQMRILGVSANSLFPPPLSEKFRFLKEKHVLQYEQQACQTQDYAENDFLYVILVHGYESNCITTYHVSVRGVCRTDGLGLISQDFECVELTSEEKSVNVDALKPVQVSQKELRMVKQELATIKESESLPDAAPVEKFEFLPPQQPIVQKSITQQSSGLRKAAVEKEESDDTDIAVTAEFEKKRSDHIPLELQKDIQIGVSSFTHVIVDNIVDSPLVSAKTNYPSQQAQQPVGNLSIIPIKLENNASKDLAMVQKGDLQIGDVIQLTCIDNYGDIDFVDATNFAGPRNLQRMSQGAKIQERNPNVQFGIASTSTIKQTLSEK